MMFIMTYACVFVCMCAWQVSTGSVDHSYSFEPRHLVRGIHEKKPGEAKLND